MIGQAQSLTSYHLGLLRRGRMVRMRRSSADRRDTYYSLDLATCRLLIAEAAQMLHPGLGFAPAAPPGPGPEGAMAARERVLFLCTGNSARSQMAQAILECRSGSTVEVLSAGSHPKPVHPGAVRVMRERGIDIADRRSKGLEEYVDERFTRVISLCDKVREVCPAFPGPPTTTHWSMPDPSAEEAPDGGDQAFVRTADELDVRIEFLLHTMRAA